MSKHRIFWSSIPIPVLLMTAVVLLVLAALLSFKGPETLPVASSLTHEQFVFEQARLAELLESEGADAAFAYAESRLAENSSFAKDCHPLMHTLGHKAYSISGSFLAGQHKRGELCNSGYIHGLIEAGFLAFENPEEAMINTCPDHSSTSFSDWQCFHGLGHGAMYSTARNVTGSVKLCSILSTDFARQSCINGVFMEHFNLVDHSGHKAPERSSLTGYESCEEQPDNVKPECYFYAPTAYISRYAENYRGAADNCHKIEAGYVSYCEQGVGSQIMKDNVTNPSVAAVFCKKRPNEYRLACALGAAGLYMNHHADGDRAEDLCGHEFSAFSDECREFIQGKRAVYGI